jgi:hypothetical protein
MTSFFKRIGLAACVLATGLAQAQPPWHLPNTVQFPGYCDLLTNVTYTGPAQWGWYTGIWDATACAIPTGLVSGPEVKKLMGFNGPGAALTLDDGGAFGQTYIFILNSDQTWALWDMAGNLVNSGGWLLTAGRTQPSGPSLLRPRTGR